MQVGVSNFSIIANLGKWRGVFLRNWRLARKSLERKAKSVVIWDEVCYHSGVYIVQYLRYQRLPQAFLAFHSRQVILFPNWATPFGHVAKNNIRPDFPPGGILPLLFPLLLPPFLNNKLDDEWVRGILNEGGGWKWFYLTEDLTFDGKLMSCNVVVCAKTALLVGQNTWQIPHRLDFITSSSTPFQNC